MTKKIISVFFIVMLNLYGYGCTCVKGFSCQNVIPGLKAANSAINLNYKMMDKIMASQMAKIKQNAQIILQKQKIIHQLSLQIEKIQAQIALQNRKKVFLLNKIKKIKQY